METTFADKITQVDNAIPDKLATTLLVSVGVIFILVGIFAKSNILKVTLFTYAIVP